MVLVSSFPGVVFRSEEGWHGVSCWPNRHRGLANSRNGVLCLPFESRIRAYGDAGAGRRVSSDDDDFLFGFGRHGSQGFFAPVFQDQGDRFS